VNYKGKGKRISLSCYMVTFTAGVIGALLAINQLFHLHIFGFNPINTAYYYCVIACFLSTCFLIYPAREKDKERLPWYDWALFAITIVVNIYMAAHARESLSKGWEFQAPLVPMICGAILWLLALEGIRRAGGKILFFICTFISLYPIFCGFLPGFLYGSQYSFTQAIAYHSMGVESIIGLPIRVVSDLLIGFMLFGVALVTSGGGKFFMEFALAIMGRQRGGAAKVSVLSSAFMASLSGSVISNIVTTGAITIPAMKKTGYSNRYAGAIEACSSTGGAIMPPIMGAAGFLVALFLGVPYTDVMVAAFFPATLYYLTLLLQVDNQAAVSGIGGMPKEELPEFWPTLKWGWPFIGSLLMLVYILIVMRIESWAPFFTTIFLILTAMMRRETRYTFSTLIDLVFEFGKLMANLVGILAGIGLIMGALGGTGVANSFSRELVLLAGNNVFLLLIIGAITSFVMGIGMPITACYVFLAVCLVPALVQLGLNAMACHLFVLYWGCLSFITPPVAIGSIAAASLAESDPMKTAWLSMKLGAAKYIVPFFFVLDPHLILVGSVGSVLLAVATAIIGCILLAASLEGWLLSVGRINFYYRVPVGLSALLLMYPGIWSNLAGASILAASFLLIKIFPATNRISEANIQSLSEA